MEVAERLSAGCWVAVWWVWVDCQQGVGRLYGRSAEAARRVKRHCLEGV